MRFRDEHRDLSLEGKWFIQNLRPFNKLQENKAIHSRCISKVRQKAPIRVAFFVINAAIWKYDYLYKLLKEDSRFEPIIFICPFITYGQENLEQELKSTERFFAQKGYATVKTRNNDGTWLDVKTEYQPDIVFFSTPWNHTRPEYTIKHFDDTLTCYVPYGFTVSTNYRGHYNLPTQNYCWKFFVESPKHNEFAQQYSLAKGANVVVSGYPGIDTLLDKQYTPKDVWKPQNKLKKKIIWAPHHTIKGAKNHKHYSTFLAYAEAMLKVAMRYEDEAQFAFKPHPNLKAKLSSPQLWGKEKTEQYFKKWQALPNGQLEEGEYIDLFLGSDALLHDSASFLIEYLATHKPMLFLVGSDKTLKEFNPYGKSILEHIEQGFDEQDIITFIEQTVLAEKDRMREKREHFLEEFVLPTNGKLPSEIIYHNLLEAFNLGIRKG